MKLQNTQEEKKAPFVWVIAEKNPAARILERKMPILKPGPHAGLD